ncbi:MAG: DUF6079 family protein [Oscillospiraceae bacterium]|nr:DUF6079 family protein [Oscillospiraceae bacterium]
MAISKYCNYLEMSPNFESVVDIDADTRNKDLWREYIVGDDMEKLMNVLCQSLNNEEPDSRRSFWIEGTYGTGKSYAAIVVKHLIEEKPEVVDAFLAGNSRLQPYRNRFMKCRAKDKGDYLVIWKTGCTGIRDGNALLMEAEKAIRDALAAKFGDKADYGSNSLQDAILKVVDNPANNWSYIIENSELSEDFSSVEELRKSLKNGNINALQKTANIIRKNNWGLIDSVETFKKWVSDVIDSNGLSKSGIFFIWDEFTEYVANSEDHTILQQLSEFCKVQPFFMLFVVHKTTAMVERMTSERYQQITHRFHSVSFSISQDAAFDLIAGSIKIRNGMEEHWKEARSEVIKRIHPYLPDISGIDDKISERIEHLCPMHPMTIRLLSRVAENYAASQRTMFRFMKDQANSELGFVGYIQNYGPDDQACWLTPDWLWDYFFTRESDFSDKETKVPEYIRHYETNKHLVENDENALRIFKTAMLLMALMTTTKGMYSTKRAKDGVANTVECLENCLAGVIPKETVNDMLNTMVDSKILVLDKAANGDVRLQLPFSGTGDSFSSKYKDNDKKYTRYKMFEKGGVFSEAFEKNALDPNEALSRRIKVAVCCSETISINARLEEVKKELEKNTYKLGLLVVVVKNDIEINTVQLTLQQKITEVNEPRLVIALCRQPLNDEDRNKWLTAITKQELAAEAGQTGSVSQYKAEAEKVVTSWASSATTGGRITAFNGSESYSNIYGMRNLCNSIIRNQVMKKIFKFAPENIVPTNTVYRPCSENAVLAGVQRKSGNSQFNGVLNSLKQAGVLEFHTIDELIAAKDSGSKQAECVAEMAELVKKEMDSGHRVNLSDLWDTLQKEPFGYYNTIACGILLGFVFSCYKDSKFSWTDNMQATHPLNESHISKMVSMMCSGKMTNDYVSAGSLTWQNFSDYLGNIFNLSQGQLAEQTTGWHYVREAVTKCGSPFWALKYLPENSWSSEDHRDAASKIIDGIGEFISHGDSSECEAVMSDTLQLFNGRGKIKKTLASDFQDKSTMNEAFRTFLFESSPELKEVVERLSVHSEELSDKVQSVMQGAIYSWTEEEVEEKLGVVTEHYRLLEAIGNAQGTVYHSMGKAKQDTAALFGVLRIPLDAIKPLNKPWFSALKVFEKVAFSDTDLMSLEEQEQAISDLNQYGAAAMDCLKSGKSVLEDILASHDISCTKDELSSVYSGLSDCRYNMTLTQFNKELNAQLDKISLARNKSRLLELWISITGKESIKEWCNVYGVPLLWIVPDELSSSFRTLLNVQNRKSVDNKSVENAINSLQNMDTSILNDEDKIQKAFKSLIGKEFSQFWDENKDGIIADTKYKMGNDMSLWSVQGLSELLSSLKRRQKEKAKKEKLANAKNTVRAMQETVLKNRVAAFLDEHPEYCDRFTD